MKNQRGLTLVELMVGVGVGIMASLAIMTSSRYLEAQKRLTVASNTSMDSLGIVKNILASDVRMSGLGMAFGGSLFCDTFQGASFVPPVSVTNPNLATAPSDLINVMFVNAPYGIASTTTSQDILTQNPQNPLPLSYVPTPPDVISKILTRDSTNQCVIVEAGRASAVSITVPRGATAIPISDYQNFTYYVANNRLMRRDNLTQTAVEVAPNIVFMKVYGLVNGTWVPAVNYPFVRTATLAQQFSTTAPGALKIYLVARQQNFSADKDGQGACTTSTQASLNALFRNGPVVTLTGSDWSCYSYKGLEVIVPLTNLSLGAQVL